MTPIAIAGVAFTDVASSVKMGSKSTLLRHRDRWNTVDDFLSDQAFGAKTADNSFYRISKFLLEFHAW